MSLASFPRVNFHVFENKTLVCNVFIDKTIHKQKETVVVNSHMIIPYNLQKKSTTYEKFNLLLDTYHEVTHFEWETFNTFVMTLSHLNTNKVFNDNTNMIALTVVNCTSLAGYKLEEYLKI